MQYLHRDKRLDERAVPAIRRIAEKIFTVLKGSNFTGYSDIDWYYWLISFKLNYFNYFVSCSYIDTIAQQFLMYRTETLDANLDELTSYAFWNKIGEILNLQGNSKFGDLVKLVKACLS